ncbi:Permease of the drug/metabolite transporter (DMT) superfamily [Vibrio gazogenes DSM 21264]|uniref:Permease of the drug/metabolite transporter (DMT) superfamily n=1 Tax=Vibrio gazogenes DSM 21264 = NBRC 103151 TaxID=1123492 RepID=A0A1M5BRF4_VIBGA|nr:Permease of the drug/metabolite transporter (DMT) superfamily [Vibrio gazogenes DSM 21264] [Vibrio gazogenes DSM 21264 = NBRC 103151]SJN54423.1 aromatic amino acid exporter [Vibrio gazogenes]
MLCSGHEWRIEIHGLSKMNNNLINEKQALLFGLTAVLLWSTVATAFKLTLAQLTPIQMLAVACVVSVISLLMICAYQRQLGQILPTFAANPKYFIISGLINPLCYYLILFQAYRLLPASQAQSINYSWAMTLTIMAAIFLKQTIRKQDYLAAALCYLGVLVIATRGNLLALDFASPVGVGLALLSTLLWAGYWILNTRNTADPVVSLLLGFLVALPCTLILSLYEGADWSHITAQGWLSAVYVGLFEMGITFFLWLNALKRTRHTARISNLIFISPFISLLLLAVIIQEQIHPTTLIGLVCIITGLTIQQLKPKRTSPPQETKQ